MNSLSRATLAASHLAVAGLGVMAGFQMPADPSSVAGLEEPGSPAPSSSVEKSKPAHANPPHAEAWESLNDRSLPRSDRLAIQKTLLREWSRIDLEAALHAALTETPRDQDGLLAACSPGMLANPSQAWDLVMARSFGWETALARSMWIGLMMKNQPADYFSKLPEMPRSDRLRTLGSMSRAAQALSPPTTTRRGGFSRIPAPCHFANQPLPAFAASSPSWQRLLCSPPPSSVRRPPFRHPSAST